MRSVVRRGRGASGLVLSARDVRLLAWGSDESARDCRCRPDSSAHRARGGPARRRRRAVRRRAALPGDPRIGREPRRGADPSRRLGPQTAPGALSEVGPDEGARALDGPGSAGAAEPVGSSDGMASGCAPSVSVVIRRIATCLQNHGKRAKSRGAAWRCCPLLPGRVLWHRGPMPLRVRTRLCRRMSLRRRGLRRPSSRLRRCCLASCCRRRLGRRGPTCSTRCRSRR